MGVLSKITTSKSTAALQGDKTETLRKFPRQSVDGYGSDKASDP